RRRPRAALPGRRRRRLSRRAAAGGPHGTPRRHRVRPRTTRILLRAARPARGAPRRGARVPRPPSLRRRRLAAHQSRRPRSRGRRLHGEGPREAPPLSVRARLADGAPGGLRARARGRGDPARPRARARRRTARGALGRARDADRRLRRSVGAGAARAPSTPSGDAGGCDPRSSVLGRPEPRGTGRTARRRHPRVLRAQAGSPRSDAVGGPEAKRTVHVLVTGAAGFIGSNAADALVARGDRVRGVDSFLDYYPRDAKERNLAGLRKSARFEFVEADLVSADLRALLDGIDAVLHFAAQAGVRASWGKDFRIYADSNVLATQRLLEACTEGKRRLVYSSSSSIYGDAPDLPTVETTLPRPISPYGVTKLAGEHLCRLYTQSFGLPTISLRYFTVYGPRQRPDMAFHRFIRAHLAGRPVTVYDDGDQTRDFTFVG